ncbi:hypothetical protein [Agrobacterium tumefaciens]|uniref:hypothetical protein n=1 Tax=Agrobacterium tumefaciens TaxID=358 RepID=UPI001571669C|nr:hypothetical protein [Agrobacterium tumefaciens]
MKASERKRLHAACRAIAAGYPELQRRQGEPPEESARSIEDEMAGFLGAVLEDRESVYRSAGEALQPLMLLFDVALLQVCDMSHFGFRHAGGRARIIWPGVHLPKRPRPNDVLYVLTSNLAHAMQAFRLLILHGFESQARAAFRGVVEIADLMIMVLADEATYRAYVTSFEDGKTSYQHWKKHLSPAVIRASLSKFEADDRISIPIDMTPEEIRKDNYAWLSRFVHVDYAAHVVAAHPSHPDGQWQRMAMLGNVGEISKATLAHSLVYLWISLLRLEKLLFEKHGWDRLRGDRNRAWFRYRARALDELFLAYLPTFWEEDMPLGLDG